MANNGAKLSITQETLKKAGVDLRLTKKELVDLLLDQAYEDLETRLEELQKEIKAELKTHNDAEEARYDAELKALQSLDNIDKDKLKNIKSVQRALTKLWEAPTVLRWCRGCLFVVLEGTVADKTFTGDPWRQQFCTNVAVTLPEMPNVICTQFCSLSEHQFKRGWSESYQRSYTRLSSEPSAHVQSLLEEHTHIFSQLVEFKKNSRKFRVQVMRQLLGASAEGQQVLSMLDGVRTTAQLHKKLTK